MIGKLRVLGVDPGRYAIPCTCAYANSTRKFTVSSKCNSLQFSPAHATRVCEAGGPDSAEVESRLVFGMPRTGKPLKVSIETVDDQRQSSKPASNGLHNSTLLPPLPLFLLLLLATRPRPCSQSVNKGVPPASNNSIRGYYGFLCRNQREIGNAFRADRIVQLESRLNKIKEKFCETIRRSS